MPSPFGLVLWTTDIRSLAGFLAEVAGVEVVAQHPGLAELDAAGQSLTLVEDEADRGHPWWEALSRDGVARGAGVILRFQVPDVVHAHATAQQMGAGSVLPPHDLEGTRECQVVGPDGYLCALWQPHRPGMAPLAGNAIRRDPTRSKPLLGGIIRRR